MQARDDYVMIPEREIDPATGEVYAPVMVGFALQPKLDGKATAAAGHDVYKDVEFVKIVIPGDKLTMFEQPASAHVAPGGRNYRERFPNAYEAFKRRDLKPVHGMPLEEWPSLPRSMALTLRSAHIETVEALSEVTDQHIDKLGYGFRDLRQKARAFLAHAKDSSATNKLAQEKEDLQRQLAAMQAQINALAGAGPAKEQPRAVPVQVAPDVKTDVVAAARRPRLKATA